MTEIAGNGAEPILLTRQQIVTRDDLPFTTLNVPEWGGTIGIRGLTGTERGKWEESLANITRGADPDEVSVQIDFSMAEMRVTLCAMCICDAEKKRLFKDSEVAMLGQKSALALKRVYDVAMHLAGMSPEAVEEAGKGSQPTPEESDDSVSA